MIKDKIAYACSNLAEQHLEPTSADISALEKPIDEIVYKLYNLTPEEIAIVEGKRCLWRGFVLLAYPAKGNVF